MTTIKSSTVWSAYVIVCAVGFVGLTYLTRTVPPGWATLSLPFAFPVVLVAIGALAAHVDAAAPLPQKSGSTSLLGRAAGGIQREPLRSSTIVAGTMLTPFFAWMFPADVGIPGIHLFLRAGGWLAPDFRA